MMILSASAIATLKACPWRYRNAYHLRIRKAEEPEARRMGTNWHEALEVASLKPEQPCPKCSDKMHPDKACPLCEGTGYIADPLDAVTRLLNDRYEKLYPGLPKASADVERTTLLFSLFSYQYHYDKTPVKVIAREIPFRIPLLNPETHTYVPDVMIDGKIDKLIQWDGRLAVMEHKSTSDSVAPDSDYWGHLRLDTQTMLYLYACQRLLADGLLEPHVKHGFVGDIIYDVWHKPQISPKKLSQTDTKAFVESGDYFGRKFSVGRRDIGNGVVVDEEDAETEILKSGAPAIRETPDMFGCRLFNDMETRPDYYFARKLLTRTSEELERFEWELYSLYQTVSSMEDNDSWYHNEHSCDNFGRCDYCQFCFSGTELDPKHPPTGFVNLGDRA